MKNIIKSISKRRIWRYFVIPLFLLAFWIVLTISYIVNFDTSFSIWSYNHNQSNFTKLTFNNLNKGDQIAGHFIAQDKNLGIVAIRFQTYIRPPFAYEDKFLFRIREKGSKNWYYQNTYRSGLIYDVPFFPFGFPQIANSKGKEYEFELISLNGNAINSISISDRPPILVSKYKYSRYELTTDKRLFVDFFTKKIYNAMFTPDVWFSSIIYFLPLLFYLFWISVLEKYFEPFLGPFIKAFKRVFVLHFDTVIVLVVLTDILVIQLTNDIVYLVIILLWILAMKAYGSTKKSFLFGVLLLIGASIALVIKAEPTAEKAAIWAYMFLVAGTIQALLELRVSKIKND